MPVWHKQMNIRRFFGGDSPKPRESYEQRSAKYGYDVVSADAVRQIYRELALPRLRDLGLNEIKPQLCGNEIADGIVHLFEMSRGKGTTYGFHWGVSASWIPRNWSST